MHAYRPQDSSQLLAHMLCHLSSVSPQVWVQVQAAQLTLMLPSVATFGTAASMPQAVQPAGSAEKQWGSC